PFGGQPPTVNTTARRGRFTSDMSLRTADGPLWTEPVRSRGTTATGAAPPPGNRFPQALWRRGPSTSSLDGIPCGGVQRAGNRYPPAVTGAPPRRSPPRQAPHQRRSGPHVLTPHRDERPGGHGAGGGVPGTRRVSVRLLRPGPAGPQQHRSVVRRRAAIRCAPMGDIHPVVAGPWSDVFVGRTGEVDVLGRLVAAAVAAGRGGSVYVEGEAGIGKSAVLAAGLSQAGERGCQLFWCAADAARERLPL